MKSIHQSGWTALLVLCAATASAQTARPSKQYTIEQFLNTTSISGASFSADESRILFSSNKTGIWNVYAIPVTGGEWTPITRSATDSTYAVPSLRRMTGSCSRATRVATSSTICTS